MAKDDGIAAAKAKLIEVAGQLDLLAPVREHPLLSVAIAGVGGVVLGASTEHLAGAASLTRSITSLLKAAIDGVERFSQPQAVPPENPSPIADPTPADSAG